MWLANEVGSVRQECREASPHATRGCPDQEKSPLPPFTKGVLRDPVLLIETKQPIPPPFVKGDRGGFDKA